METRRIEKLRGHWKTTLIKSDGIRFCYDECIFCGYRTSLDTIAGRKKQTLDHEREHPKEQQTQDFWRLRNGLHDAAIDVNPYHGLDAFQWGDTEEWRELSSIYSERDAKTFREGLLS